MKTVFTLIPKSDENSTSQENQRLASFMNTDMSKVQLGFKEKEEEEGVCQVLREILAKHDALSWSHLSRLPHCLESAT